MGGVTKTIGGVVAGGLLGGAGGAIAGGLLGSKFGGGNSSAPTIGGSMSKMDMLTSTGGAPLLMNVALGADPYHSLFSFLGINERQYAAAKAGQNSNLTGDDVKAIDSLLNQLNEVKSNTDLRNKAVQKLADDFPNIMHEKIKQYSSIADDATKQMMDQALGQISAKYAAGGQLSSGATAEAAAKAAAGIGMDKLNYATGLAGQDWMNQYNIASGLQSFQQKMLGQGAVQGFNAIQNALAGNRGIQQEQANLNFKSDLANQQSQQGLWGGLGALGGTVVGGMFGGPVGAMAGNQIGGNVFGNLGRSNKLSLGNNASAGYGA